MKKAKRKSLSSTVPRRDMTSDTEAFEREMADVVPLRPDARGGRVLHTPPINMPAAARPPREPLDGDDEAFAAPGVDRREIRKLRRGDYAVGDRYDLHGMTAAEARASVEHFIDSRRHGRQRCVCIVHGRGLHSEGGTAVLRAQVRKYLRSHRSVLAYSDAPRSDGGSGAVYVLLRKSN